MDDVCMCGPERFGTCFQRGSGMWFCFGVPAQVVQNLGEVSATVERVHVLWAMLAGRGVQDEPVLGFCLV